MRPERYDSPPPARRRHAMGELEMNPESAGISSPPRMVVLTGGDRDGTDGVIKLGARN